MTRLNICLLIIVAGLVTLFGSLLVSVFTNNAIWFIYGYPLSIAFLVVSLRFR